MGNKLGKKRQAVDERYTKPQQGLLLYMNKDVDFKKLKKLILEAKLAPCYPGAAEDISSHDLEECPICYLVCVCRLFTRKKCISFQEDETDCDCMCLFVCFLVLSEPQ